MRAYQLATKLGQTSRIDVVVVANALLIYALKQLRLRKKLVSTLGFRTRRQGCLDHYEVQDSCNKFDCLDYIREKIGASNRYQVVETQVLKED